MTITNLKCGICRGTGRIGDIRLCQSCSGVGSYPHEVVEPAPKRSIRKYAAMYNAHTKTWSVVLQDGTELEWYVYVPDAGNESTAKKLTQLLSYYADAVKPDEPPTPCRICHGVWDHVKGCELNG